MHRTLTILGIASTLALTAGCYDCDMMAVASVSVTVTDADGNTIEDVLVRYLLVAEDWADHEDCEPAYDDASHWSCGFEAEGEIEVEASAPGFLSETQAVHVSGGRCHVSTEAIDFWLEPAP